MTLSQDDMRNVEVAAADAAATSSETAAAALAAGTTASQLNEDVVISSFLASTIKGQTDAVAEAISHISGVEVHETHNTTLVLTIEAPTIQESTKIATEVNLTEGVITLQMIFANFEDDPVIKAQKAKLQKEQQA
ncbi:MAG: chaperone NapD [Coriobacteriia bacterium]|nr:chaperone NapD [Coriobacteriia bacterium]